MILPLSPPIPARNSQAGQSACLDDWPRVFDLLLRMKSGEALLPGGEEKSGDVQHFAEKTLKRTKFDIAACNRVN